MFVMTVDQKKSRVQGDLVPDVLDDLTHLLAGERSASVAIPFQRSVGDEIQGVLKDPLAVVAVTRRLIKHSNWYVGIGYGSVAEPLPQRSSEASGTAFIHARSAVEDAKVMRGAVPISVRSGAYSGMSTEAKNAQAALRLMGLSWQDRSPLAWEAIDGLVDDFGLPSGHTQSEVAVQLGVSSAAISKRLKGAAFDEERAIYPLLVQLLDQLKA